MHAVSSIKPCWLPRFCHLVRRYGSTSTSLPRWRRAMLNVPGHDMRKIEKALGMDVLDAIVLDIEDGVAPSMKSKARENIFSVLQSSKLERELVVRVNAMDTNDFQEDLKLLARLSRLDAIVLPKIETPAQLSHISQSLHQALPSALRNSLQWIVAIESAKGILFLNEIAASNPCITALVFASEDYCADTGIHRTRDMNQFLYARSKLAVVAHAYKMQAIDLVTLDFKNQDILVTESTHGRQLGFTGKQAIHPDQVPTIQRIFSPSESEILKATTIIKAYQAHLEHGQGVFELHGQVIDIPVVKWAGKILKSNNK